MSNEFLLMRWAALLYDRHCCIGLLSYSFSCFFFSCPVLVQKPVTWQDLVSTWPLVSICFLQHCSLTSFLHFRTSFDLQPRGIPSLHANTGCKTGPSFHLSVSQSQPVGNFSAPLFLFWCLLPCRAFHWKTLSLLRTHFWKFGVQLFQKLYFIKQMSIKSYRRIHRWSNINFAI